MALLALVGTLVTGCALGERPTIEDTPTAVGTMTGEPAIDAVLDRFDAAPSAMFTADYTAILAFGGTTTAVAVTQDGRDPAATRRAVTIGDVRYITAPAGTSTCSVAAATCTSGIDAARVSDTGVTPEFASGDMAKRLRRDAVARIGTPTASTMEVAGATATCVDVPVTGGTKQYCAFDDGALARFVGGDVTIDVNSYRPTVDDAQFVI
jgi:hypothetical protein